MAEKWRRKMQNGNKLYPYKEPFLSKPADNDLSKQWVVEYGAWSLKKEKVIRKRVVITGKTVAERLEHAKAIIKELTRVLKKGSFIDDLPKPKTKAAHKPVPIVRADPEPGAAGMITHHTKILVAVKEFLRYKEKTVSYNSFRTYRTHIRTLEKYLEDTDQARMLLRQFNAGDALKFLDATILQYSLSNRSRNAINNTSRMVFAHWVDRINKITGKEVLKNPFVGIGDLTTKAYKHTAYTSDQRRAFKEACGLTDLPDLLLFVSFIYYTFMRPRQEIRLLRIRSLKPKTIFVSAEDAKDNEAEQWRSPRAWRH